MTWYVLIHIKLAPRLIDLKASMISENCHQEPSHLPPITTILPARGRWGDVCIGWPCHLQMAKNNFEARDDERSGSRISYTAIHQRNILKTTVQHSQTQMWHVTFILNDSYVQGSLAPLSELMDKHWEHDAQFVKHFKQPCWPITRHSAAPSHGHCPCRLSHICRVGFKKNFRTKNCDGPIAHCTNTPMVLFHYDFNVSDCLFEFYCQNTWCQDQAIKSFFFQPWMPEAAWTAKLQCPLSLKGN